MQLPLGLSPYQWQRGPEASTFSSGYVTGVGPGVAFAARPCAAWQVSLWGSSSFWAGRVVSGRIAHAASAALVSVGPERGIPEALHVTHCLPDPVLARAWRSGWGTVVITWQAR